MIERWLPVVGYEGRYEVSDLGRVRSLDCVVKKHMKVGSIDRVVDHRLKGRVLRPSGHRYSVVRLQTEYIKVHRLVLTAFRGPCPDGMEACHKDRDTTNNTLANLRWDTSLANHEDRRRHGTIPRGETHSAAVLTSEQVLAIRSQVARSARSLAREFGVSASAVRAVRNGKTWRHLKDTAP